MSTGKWTNLRYCKKYDVIRYILVQTDRNEDYGDLYVYKSLQTKLPFIYKYKYKYLQDTRKKEGGKKSYICFNSLKPEPFQRSIGKENRPCKRALYNGITAFGSIIVYIFFHLQLWYFLLWRENRELFLATMVYRVYDFFLDFTD